MPLLDPALIDRARDVAECAQARGLADTERPFTIIDYRLPSTEPRLWVIRLDTGEVLFQERVAHGRNTGEDAAAHFSNVEGSRQSSVGVFRTAEVYSGEHGRSLRLDGLEPGFNDHARDRAIVVHGADYVSEDFIAEHGRLGRSWGCPALAPAVVSQVIDTIAGGSLVLAWYPDSAWLAGSQLLHCRG